MRTLAIFAASYAAAVLIAVYAGLERGLLPLGLFFAVLCLAAVCTRSRTGRKGTVISLCAAGLAAGFLWTLGYQSIFVFPARALDGQTVYLTARVIQWPEAQKRDYSVLVRADVPGGSSVDTLLYIDEQGADLRPGDQISSVVHCRFADRTFAGEEITYYTAKGVFLRGTAYGQLHVERPERVPLSCLPAYLARALEENILSAYSGESGTQVLAIVTGNRKNLSQSFTSSLQRTGLSHTAAVSGMHLSFLSAFFTCLLGKHRRRTALVIMPASVCLMVVAGCTPSVVRATVMILLLLTAPLFGRERDDATALATALLVLLVQNPLSVTHVGLQLSFGAVAGIFLVSDPIQRRLNRLLPAASRRVRGIKRLIWVIPDYFVSTLSATLGASVFTIPLCAIHFSSVSLLSPISNFLTLWAVAVVFCSGLMVGIVGSISPAAAEALAALSTPFAAYMDGAVRWLARNSFASITLDSFAYQLWTILLSFVILFLLVRHSRRTVLAAGALCAVTLGIAVGFTALEFGLGPMRVTVLDVGQGQSVLLRQENHLTLVDCGGDSYDNAGDLAADYIQNAGRSSLDLLVLTHFHEDHANGVPQLLERLRVKTIIMPDVEEDTALRQEILSQAQRQGTQCIFLREDTVYSVGEDSSLTLFAPLGADNENERGLTVLASTGTFDALLTGDMSGEVEQLLLAHAALPDIELLVVGHHGSKYSTSQELLDAVTPELAVISVGKNNYYGHPAPETLERLAGTQVRRTDLNGTVAVQVSRRGI